MHKAGMVQRVTNEVEIQCRLKHPSILEVTSTTSSYCTVLLKVCSFTYSIFCFVYIHVYHFYV